MAEGEEKMRYCHGSCRNDGEPWKKYPKKDLIKVTDGYNIWNKPKNNCAECFEQQICKSQCNLCSVWIRQKDDMIEYDGQDYCTYCVELLDEKDGHGPFDPEISEMIIGMHEYIKGDRSNKTLITMDKAIRSAILLFNIKKKIKKDVRKKKIHDIFMSIEEFQRLERYLFVDGLTEDQLDMLSDESIKGLKDILIKLLK
jgi:hypothetical protein